MHKSIFSIGLLIVSLAVISADDKLSLPTNFTWPLNTNQLCFAARFDLTLNVEYKKNDSTNATVAIPLNNTTFQSYSAACPSSESVHQLMITLFDGLSALIFSFTVDEKNSSSLTRIYGYLMVNNQQTFIQNYAPEVEGLHKFSSNVSYFQAARDQSYRCDSKTQLTGIQTNGTLTITSIDVQNLQIQSFLDDSRNFSQYGAEIYCKADTDKNSNVIPIVVGACLAALVVIVLVAYIIGRQRSRNGYQTV